MGIFFIKLEVLSNKSGILKRLRLKSSHRTQKHCGIYKTTRKPKNTEEQNWQIYVKEATYFWAIVFSDISEETLDYEMASTSRYKGSVNLLAQVN